MSNLSRKQQRFFEIAKQVSLLSDFPRVKIGCIIVSKKKHIISSGFNKQKTHPKQFLLNKRMKSCGCNKHKQNNSFIHAEIDAISYINSHTLDLSDAEIYLYREDVNGNLAASRPCESCMFEILKLGIRKIHYTSNFGFHSEKIL